MNFPANWYGENKGTFESFILVVLCWHDIQLISWISNQHIRLTKGKEKAQQSIVAAKLHGLCSHE